MGEGHKGSANWPRLPEVRGRPELCLAPAGRAGGSFGPSRWRLFSTQDPNVECEVGSPDGIEREAGREHERHGSDVVPRHDVHVHHHAVCVVPRKEQLHKVLRRPQRLVCELGARVREEAEQREESRAVQQR